jgi:Protein of unknown function (DUF1573)
VAYSCGKKNKIPVMEFNKIGKKIDTVIAGKTVEVIYMLKNSGKQSLIVEDYKLSCECSKTNIAKNAVVMPGDSLRIAIQIDTDSSEAGKQKVLYCTLMCNTKPQLSTLPLPIHIVK